MCSDPLKLLRPMKRRSFGSLCHREEGRKLREDHEKQSDNESPSRHENIRPANISFEERQRGWDRHQCSAVKVGEQLKAPVRKLYREFLVFKR